MSNTPATTSTSPAKKGVSKRQAMLNAAKKDETTDEEKKQALATALYELTKQWPFYGAMLSTLNITYDFCVPTAGVGFNADMKRLDLHINPMFFVKALNPKHRVAVLLHEIFHVTNKHLTRVPFFKVSDHKRRLLNIAGDMAINQNITNLPMGCPQCPPIEAQKQGEQCPNPHCCGHFIDVNDYYDEDPKTKARVPWKKGQPMEHYFELLLRHYPEKPDQYEPKKIEVAAMSDAHLDVTSQGQRATKVLTGNAKGKLVLGGKEVVNGQRVLLKDQTDAKDNGVYVVEEAGDDTCNPILKRDPLYNGTPKNELRQSDMAIIKGATKKEDVVWTLTGDAGDPNPSREVRCDFHPQVWQEGDACEHFGNGSGKGTPREFDAHDWESAEEGEVMDAVEDLVKRAMIKSSTEYSQLPGGVKDLLDEIKARRAELNYKALILAAIKRSASGHDRKGTWTRKNKRYGFQAPGTRNAELPKLDIYLDTSGSISIEELSSFLEIVDEFLRVGVRKCTINCFHTDHYFRAQYKTGDREMLKKSVQSGGTDLTGVFESIVKNKSDLSIIITDGYYGDVQVESMLKPGQSVPVTLFIISKGGQEKHPLQRIGNTVKVPDGAK